MAFGGDTGQAVFALMVFEASFTGGLHLDVSDFVVVGHAPVVLRARERAGRG